MVLVEHVDESMEVVKDPRFGPPAGTTLFEGSSDKYAAITLLLLAFVALMLGLLVKRSR